MRLENLPSEFQEALPVLKKIKNAGFEAYFVSGSVRDALLNRPIHDVDIAVLVIQKKPNVFLSERLMSELSMGQF